MSRRTKTESAFPAGDVVGVEVDARLLADRLWQDVLEPFVNGGSPQDAGWAARGLFPLLGARRLGPFACGEVGNAWVLVRRQLEALVAAGAMPFQGRLARAPLALMSRRGRVEWTLTSATRSTRPSVEGFVEETVFGAMLLSHPANRRRLGRCDYCGKYFLRARARRRGDAHVYFSTLCKGRHHGTTAPRPKRRRARA